MKKKLIVISVIAVLLSILGGGTLAYFSAEATAHNVITSGGIDIELLEWADPDREVPFPEEGVSGVMPGADITKIVEIENTGANEAWVRIRMERSIQLVNAPAGTQPDLSLIQLDIDTEHWTLRTEGGVDYYYYNDSLAPGDTTDPLFTTVKFKGPEMGNLYQNSTFTIDLKAHAVQTANNGATPLEAGGWPNEP